MLDAVRQFVHATAQYEKEGDLGEELLKAERELSELTQKQGILGNAMEDIGSIFLSTVGSESSDLGLKVMLGRIFQRITGMPVKAHLCARLEISDLTDEWMVIDSKNERQATHELLQCVKRIAAKTSELDYNMNRDTVGIKAKKDDSGGRFVYLLLDAKDVVIGALVLDSSANPIAQVQSEFASTIKSVFQVAGAKVGSVRNKLKHDAQMQRMSQERDQLLLDKCQLELNSLEMKNLLHNNEANLLKLRSHYEQVVRPTNESLRTFLYELKGLTSPNEVLLQLGHAITSLKDVTGVHFAMLHEKTQKGPSTLFSSVAKDDNKRIVRSADVQDAMRRCVKQGEMIKLCVKNQSKEMQSEGASNCSQSAKCAMLYPMTIPQDVYAQTKTECERVDVAEPNPTANIVVIVLAVAPISVNSAPFPAEGDSMMCQLEQVELLLRLATMRCHMLVQRDLWKQQLDLLAEKESKTKGQIQLMSLKCDQWQAKHEFQTQLQRGLARQLALGLSSLHSGAAKAATSKQMMEMWQALSEILCDRLEAAFRSRKAVSRSNVQLYGAVQDGNFFFTFGKSTGAKTRLQLIAFQQCIKSPAHQAIWKAYASETVAESRWRDDECVDREAASESVKTMFPVMSITNEEDQGHEKVVGILEFRSEQPLDEDEKELVQEFLTWLSPAVYCIRRAVQRKMLQKHASRHGGVSTATNPHLPPRENVRSATLGISSQSLGLTSATLPSARQSREPSNPSAADDAGRRSRQDLETESSSNFGAGDEDEYESEGEAGLWRKKREQLLPGIVTLLLRLQETNDLRALAKTVRHEMKRLWTCHTKKTRQSIHDCQLIRFEGTGAEHQTSARSNNDDMEVAPWVSELMKSGYKLRGTAEFEVLQGVDSNAPSGSGEQFRLICLPEINDRGARYCLLITGSYLDDMFDADDERVHLPQIARGIQRQLSQLYRMTRLQEEASELQTIKQEGATLIAKASQLERNVADMSGFLEFQSAINGIEGERALSNFVTDYLKKLLRCERIVFQGVVPGPRVGAEQSLSFTEAHIGEGDSVQFATSTLAMDNLLRLRVFSPHASGAELLAICTARMGTKSQPLDVHKQELLKRVSPIIGSAMHRLRVQEKLSHQVRVGDNAKSEIERLSRENRELHSQLQQQSHCKEDFDIRLGDQQVLVAENKRLEAQLSKMMARLDAFAGEQEEQQFELAAREKANAKLIFQLDQFAKVEAQIQHMDGENSALRHREKKLEK